MNGAEPWALTAIIAAYNEGEEWLDQLKEYLDENICYIEGVCERKPSQGQRDGSVEGTYLIMDRFQRICGRRCQEVKRRSCRRKPRVALDEGYIFGDAGRG